MKPEAFMEKHKIAICTGGRCRRNGAFDLLNALSCELKIKAGDAAEESQFSLETVPCTGRCGLAPVITVDGNVYDRVDMKKARQIITNYRM